MVKLLKYLGITLVACILAGYLSLQWIVNWSPFARQANARQKKLNQVRIGMYKSDFVNILGDPDYSIIAHDNNLDTSYYYKMPAFSSGDIKIKTHNNRVISIYDGN